jgi:hypothetical protein
MLLTDRKGGPVTEPKDKKVEFLSHAIVGVILSSIRRNGLEKTLEDLNHNCRDHPESDEIVYQGLLKLVSTITEDRRRIAEAKKHYN